MTETEAATRWNAGGGRSRPTCGGEREAIRSDKAPWRRETRRKVRAVRATPGRKARAAVQAERVARIVASIETEGGV